MSTLPVRPMSAAVIDGALTRQYAEYLKVRIAFLLDRFRRFPDFPGVHTGYNSITGEEFGIDDCFPYSWINGRGACVFARFAGHFPEHGDELNAYAQHAIEALETHERINGGHFPFMANLDGTERQVGVSCPPGFKSYSDLYAGAGFVEFGARRRDADRARRGRRILEETVAALEANRFVTEPDPTPPDRILENPWAVALDLANECAKQIDMGYLRHGAALVSRLLERYYLPEKGYYVEYITPDGRVFEDERGRRIIDPGHAIEFCGFSLEFARLAEGRAEFAAVIGQIDQVIPTLLKWTVRAGWNTRHPGIVKTIDAESRRPVNDTMPWWILPETMLAVMLSYERTGDQECLELYRDAHNAYFSSYMNPVTSYGPFQNLSGETGQPVDIVPACKFQDPEFHSGKNLLAVVEVARRLGSAPRGRGA